MRRGPFFFFFFFAFHFSNHWNLFFVVPKWECRKKIRKMTLPPLKNIPLTPLGIVFISGTRRNSPRCGIQVHVTYRCHCQPCMHKTAHDSFRWKWPKQKGKRCWHVWDGQDYTPASYVCVLVPELLSTDHTSGQDCDRICSQVPIQVA